MEFASSSECRFRLNGGFNCIVQGWGYVVTHARTCPTHVGQGCGLSENVFLSSSCKAGSAALQRGHSNTPRCSARHSSWHSSCAHGRSAPRHASLPWPVLLRHEACKICSGRMRPAAAAPAAHRTGLMYFCLLMAALRTRICCSFAPRPCSSRCVRRSRMWYACCLQRCLLLCCNW